MLACEFLKIHKSAICMSTTVTFSEFLKAKQEELGVTQENLAKLISVPRDVLAKWLSNKSFPSRKHAETIIEPLEISEEYLFEMIAEGRKLKNEKGHTEIIGNYSFYQWAFPRNSKIMKTSINIFVSDKGKLSFREKVEIDNSYHDIEGQVYTFGGNMTLTGKGVGQFNEYETIITKIPRNIGSIICGVIVGLSSDYEIPSSSRTVMIYNGKIADNDTWYLTVEEIESACKPIDPRIIPYLQSESAFQDHVLQSDRNDFR